MEIGLDNNINAEANLLEEDNTIAGLDGYNYVYNGLGPGIFVPALLDPDDTTQADLIGPADEINSTTGTPSLDNDNSASDDITGGTGSTGNTDLISIDDFEIKKDSTPVSGNTENTNTVDFFEASSEIVDDWNGGYKLEVDITATSSIDDWTIEFDFPHEIREFYGVDLVDNEDNSYTIEGEDGQKDLETGEIIKSIFVVDDNGENAIAPKLTSPDTETSGETNNTTNNAISGSPDSESGLEEPKVEPDNSPDDIKEEPPVEPGNSPDDTKEEPPIEPSATNEINVDQEFNGDLDKAIASADDGDVVRLGEGTYITTGIKLNKDITIDGQEGTIIDGGETLQPIFTLYSGATGATIQDLEINNGNSAIVVTDAADVTLNNLDINNMGISQTIRRGPNNSGIILDHADGFRVLNSNINNIGRKAIGINNTDGGIVRGVKIQNVNLAAQHVQSFDAGGIKLFNTNDIIIKDNNLRDINGFMIWNDTTNATVIEDNVVLNAGEDFQAPDFNNNVYMAGIYNEKSSNAVVRGNKATSKEYFFAFRATEFSTETMTLGENDFTDFELNTTDYWVNEEAEKLIALTKDPDEANFDLISEAFFAQANVDD